MGLFFFHQHGPYIHLHPCEQYEQDKTGSQLPRRESLPREEGDGRAVIRSPGFCAAQDVSLDFNPHKICHPIAVRIHNLKEREKRNPDI